MSTINKLKTTFLITSLGLLLTACDGNGTIDNNKLHKLQGSWVQKGYGEVISVKNNTVDVYEFTRSTCIKSTTFKASQLKSYLNTITFSNDGESYITQSSGGLFASNLNKISQLPTPCEPTRLITKLTPTKTFEHLWHTFNDYYAFFNERSVDWNRQYAIYHPQIKDDMNDQALFDVLKEMLSPISDGHVELSSDTDSFTPPTQMLVNFIQQLRPLFNQQTEYTNPDAFISAQLENAKSLPEAYIRNVDADGGKSGDVIRWGMIDNTEIGYINITSMSGFADNASDDANLDTTKEIKALNAIMDRVISALSETRSIIIDVRFNDGGNDVSSMIIANRFATQRQRVLSKYTRSFSGDTAQVHAYTSPTTKTYTKPIAILSSELTASAAEIFLMTMGSFPHVTLIGEPSSGELSDQLEKRLPNGWNFSLSNEIYLDSVGRKHEVNGVPVDINVPAISVADLIANKDSALEAAIHSF